MDKLRKSFRSSFRKSKYNQKDEESSAARNSWPNDEAAVRTNTCSFQVKYLGCVEVYESRGMQVCEEALKLLKSSKLRSTRGTLWVSGDGLRVSDSETKGLVLDQTIEKVSFCAPDRNYERGFSYICRDGTTRRWMCHGFLAVGDTGERLSHAVGCAFAICLDKKQQREKECPVQFHYNKRDNTFTRFGSFQQGSIKDRLTDPQEFKPSQPPPNQPKEPPKNPFAVARPKASDLMFIRQASMRGLGKLSGNTPFKRQYSLRLDELPSTLSRQAEENKIDPRVVTRPSSAHTVERRSQIISMPHMPHPCNPIQEDEVAELDPSDPFSIPHSLSGPLSLPAILSQASLPPPLIPPSSASPKSLPPPMLAPSASLSSPPIFPPSSSPRSLPHPILPPGHASPKDVADRQAMPPPHCPPTSSRRSSSGSSPTISVGSPRNQLKSADLLKSSSSSTPSPNQLAASLSKLQTSSRSNSRSPLPRTREEIRMSPLAMENVVSPEGFNPWDNVPDQPLLRFGGGSRSGRPASIQSSADLWSSPNYSARGACSMDYIPTSLPLAPLPLASLPSFPKPSHINSDSPASKSALNSSTDELSFTASNPTTKATTNGSFNQSASSSSALFNQSASSTGPFNQSASTNPPTGILQDPFDSDWAELALRTSSTQDGFKAPGTIKQAFQLNM